MDVRLHAFYIQLLHFLAKDLLLFLDTEIPASSGLSLPVVVEQHRPNSGGLCCSVAAGTGCQYSCWFGAVAARQGGCVPV